MIFSCIVPCLDKNDPLLKDLIKSIRAQDFDQDQIEIIVVTEGDSEQAKAIGIKRAKGDICLMLCADNVLSCTYLFSYVSRLFRDNSTLTGVYSRYYKHVSSDNSLNRYFSLLGANDPIAFYLGKADRKPYFDVHKVDEISTQMIFLDKVPSLGCNGFFFRRKDLLKADLDHYYPMDVAEDLRRKEYCTYIRLNIAYIHHKTTDGNLLTFLKKRYKYAKDLYCDRGDRRWRMVDTNKDMWRLSGFIMATLTLFPCLYTSIKGYSKGHKDIAWFWHWPVCVGFLITYGILACRNLFLHRSLFQVSTEKTI